MTSFYNPFQFIPVEAPTLSGKTSWTPLTDLAGPKATHQSHAAWVGEQDGQPVYSGRLLCRLETESPTVVGGRRTPGTDQQPAQVQPFKLDGECAIPAASLRGMISSIYEAATQSSMRVMPERESLSYRVGADSGKSLSAVGRIAINKNGPGWVLIPLALPTLIMDRSNRLNFLPNDQGFKLVDVFNNDLVAYNNSASESEGTSKMRHLKFYLDAYRGDSPAGDIAQLQVGGVKNFVTNGIKDSAVVVISKGKPALRFARGGRSDFAIGIEWPDEAPSVVLGLAKYNAAKEAKQLPDGDLRRFVFRSLGRRAGMPTTKKHELLIPYFSDEKHISPIPVPDEVIRRFEVLAQERLDEQISRKENQNNDPSKALPFNPIGTPRNADGPDGQPSGMSLKLKAGDLVFFNVRPQADDPKKPEVAAVSFSAVWRDAVRQAENPRQNATLYDFFRKFPSRTSSVTGNELLPMDLNHRSYVSPAEALFGYVGTEAKKDEQDKRPQAHAGRLRFGFGRLDPACPSPLMGATTLRILGSPKLPSPAMYFHQPSAQKRLVTKTELKPKTHLPNGRKVYLHHPAAQGEQNAGFAATAQPRDNLKQKARVQPLKVGTAFWFEIDFDNLRQDELGALLWSLRPEAEFRHRLGMGKPLGLGSVRVDVAGLFLVDRAARYASDTLDAPRYQRAWVDSSIKAWPARYVAESHARDAQVPAAPARAELIKHAETEHLLQSAACQALCKVGRVDAAGQLDIHYPRMEDQGVEGELFKWHMENANSRNASESQGLGPVSGSVPTLKTYRIPPRRP